MGALNSHISTELPCSEEAVYRGFCPSSFSVSVSCCILFSAVSLMPDYSDQYTVVVALTCLACAEVQVSALVEAGGLAGEMSLLRSERYPYVLNWLCLI
jgi:hypothetical protein